MTSPQGQTIVQQQYAPARTRMSRWWPISFFIAAVLFFIIGGGLMGAWASSYDGYGYYADGNWYGAIACFVIASLLKLTAWILLIVWCVKSRRSSTTTVTYVNQQPQGSYAPVPVQVPQQNYGYMPEQMKSQTQAPVYQNVQPVQPVQPVQSEAMRYCANCGTGTATAFCPHCGVKAV